jgi:predicted Zn-dependent peptidase
MMFKGTAKKSSLEIVKLIEGLGGAFDAYTTKENLIIITKFLSEHIATVLDLILEILLESKFAPRDLVKEKSVVLEEIKTDEDDPSDYVFEILFEELFPGHGLGRPIAGTRSSVSRIDHECALAQYRDILDRNIVIAVSGNFDADEITRIARHRFRRHRLQDPPRIKPVYGRPVIRVQKKKEISQVHVLFGIPTFAYDSPLRRPMFLLNGALGGGMSSRLFQGLRESAGLVYDVHSFVDFYSDCGLLGFYFVCDKKNLKPIAAQLKKIFRDLVRNGFGREEIEIAKTYLTGNMLLSMESSTNRMMRLGRELIYMKRITPINEAVRQIRALGESEVNRLNKDFLDLNKYSVAAVGPVTRNEIHNLFNDLVS